MHSSRTTAADSIIGVLASGSEFFVKVASSIPEPRFAEDVKVGSEESLSVAIIG